MTQEDTCDTRSRLCQSYRMLELGRARQKCRIPLYWILFLTACDNSRVPGHWKPMAQACTTGREIIAQKLPYGNLCSCVQSGQANRKWVNPLLSSEFTIGALGRPKCRTFWGEHYRLTGRNHATGTQRDDRRTLWPILCQQVLHELPAAGGSTHIWVTFRASMSTSICYSPSLSILLSSYPEIFYTADEHRNSYSLWVQGNDAIYRDIIHWDRITCEEQLLYPFNSITSLLHYDLYWNLFSSFFFSLCSNTVCLHYCCLPVATVV